MHWFWSIWPEILLWFRDNSDYAEFTVFNKVGLNIPPISGAAGFRYRANWENSAKNENFRRLSSELPPTGMFPGIAEHCSALSDKKKKRRNSRGAWNSEIWPPDEVDVRTDYETNGLKFYSINDRVSGDMNGEKPLRKSIHWYDINWQIYDISFIQTINQ